MIVDVMPSQYKLDYALWTRGAVKELVFRENTASLGGLQTLAVQRLRKTYFYLFYSILKK